MVETLVTSFMVTSAGLITEIKAENISRNTLSPEGMKLFSSIPFKLRVASIVTKVVKASVGFVEGCPDGCIVGNVEGWDVGSELGSDEGCPDGCIDGSDEGCPDGCPDGWVGVDDGWLDG